MSHSALRTGTKIALSAGTVQLRVAEPPVVPARNHTGPFCFTAQSAPVASVTGLLGSEMLAAHCHQAADH